MPTTYTHDKFGKDVYKKLPEHIKAVIRKGKGVYRIGQHGPDIFFYYKPICLPQSRINKIGPQMHKEPAFGFFQKGILKNHFRKLGLAAHEKPFSDTL